MPLALSHDSMVLRDEENQCMVTYHKNYLASFEADGLLAWMSNMGSWETETPIIFGKPRTVKRKTCAFGDKGTSYGYSGMRKIPRAWPLAVEAVRARLAKDTNTNFNFALANLYPDGEAGIGAHSDDEPDLMEGCPIVGVSLGATRDFVLTTKEGKRVASIPLEHGSAVIMWMDTQKHYKHALPPRKRSKNLRVSLTFRVMKGSIRNPRIVLGSS